MSTMSEMGFAVVYMALKKSTVIRRAAIHHLVSDVICSGLTPVAGVDEVVCSVMYSTNFTTFITVFR